MTSEGCVPLSCLLRFLVLFQIGVQVLCHQAYLLSSNPLVACVPSQNGLFFEAPHLHSV